MATLAEPQRSADPLDDFRAQVSDFLAANFPPSLKGKGESTASQTAWGAMGLLAVFGANDPEIPGFPGLRYPLRYCYRRLLLAAIYRYRQLLISRLF